MTKHAFELHREGWWRLLVRSDAAEGVLPLMRRWCLDDLPPSRPLLGGRGGVAVYEIGEGPSVVLRPCLRGGWMSRINRDLYFGVRPRPLREVRVTEELRQRGIPTVETLGCAVRWVAPGCYRGAVASVYAVGAVNLWTYLSSTAAEDRGRVCRRVAQATRRLHDAGAIHPDLNLQNYLVYKRRGDIEVLIIDCDRVRLGRVTMRDRRAAFTRLCRSIRRLDPQAAVITLECVEALRGVTEAESG
jgi:hypothetical protein